MKRIAFVIAVLLQPIAVFGQQVKIFDSTGSPLGDNFVYQPLQDAVDNASPGDTLYLVGAGKNFSYGTLNILGKSDLTIMGPGFNPDNGAATFTGEAVFDFLFVLGSDNINISGVVVGNVEGGNPFLGDGLLTVTGYQPNSTIIPSSNVTITNSKVKQLSIAVTSNVFVSNSYLAATDISESDSGVSNVTFANNIVGGSSLRNSTLTNNLIVYDPSLHSGIRTFSNCTFIGNVFVINDQNEAQSDNNSFLTNVSNVDLIVDDTDTGSDNTIASFALSDIYPGQLNNPLNP